MERIMLRAEKNRRAVETVARGVSEREYVQNAVEYALLSEAGLEAEMRAWETVSLHDFRTFAKAHKIP